MTPCGFGSLPLRAGGAVGIGQLVAAAPFGLDVIDDQRAADAVDRPLVEAVPGVACGNEDQAAVALVGRGGDEVEVGVEYVGAPRLAARLARQVDQHGEQLGANVGVRLEPEAVGVEAIFDAQVTLVAQLDVAHPFDPLDRRGRLETGGQRVAHRMAAAVVETEEQPRAVVRLALAERIVDMGGARRQRVDSVAHRDRQDVGQQPVTVRLGGERAGVEAGDQACRNGGTVSHGPLPLWRRDAAR